MSKVYLCKGEFAENPFFIEKQRLKVYSLEELCYYIKENVCILDKSIMTPALIRFLGEDCKITALESELKQVLNRKKSMADFCECILRFDGRTNEQEMERILENIVKSESLDVYEKRKSNADFFVRKKKYLRAMIEYRKLLEETGKKDVVLYSELMHNLGVAYANLFHYKDARDCFAKAYEKGEREESLLCYLATYRMDDQEEYEKLIDENSKYLQIAATMKQTIEEITTMWEESNQPGNLNNPVYDYEIIDRKERMEQMEQIISAWKSEYRLFLEE